MALLYAEKFAKYTDDQHIVDDNPQSGITASGTGRTMQASTGRFGHTTLQMTSTATYFDFPWAAITASETVIVGFSLRDFNNTAPTAVDNQQLIGMVDASGQHHWRLDVTLGGLVLWRANGATGIVQFVAPFCLGFQRWHWIEVRATMQTSGSVEVRVDGQTVINVTATDFRDGTADALTALRIYGARMNRQYDEIVICDGTGSTFNDFFGELRIVQTVPDADGSVVNWTASAGTDVSCVDDAIAAYNGDTDYISSSTADQESLFSHGAFTLTNITSVKFVQLSTMARDDGTNTFRQLVRSGGTTFDNGSDINPVSAAAGVYDWYNHRRELDPNGSIAWTETSINAAEFGVRARP